MAFGHIICPPLFGLSFGASGVMELGGVGDPNLQSSDSPNGNLAFCAVGSTFRRTDIVDATHQFFVKTSPTTLANPTGVWTNK